MRARIIAVEYVGKPDNDFVHNVLHETLHIKLFKEYPRLGEFTDENLGETYEKEVRIKPKHEQIILLRLRLMLIMDMFVEREILSLNTNFAISALTRDIKEWIDYKSRFLEIQNSDKPRALIALDKGILPIYLRYRYMRSGTQSCSRLISKLLSWFPRDVRKEMTELGDYVSILHPGTISLKDIIEVHKRITLLLYHYSEHIGFDFLRKTVKNV